MHTAARAVQSLQRAAGDKTLNELKAKQEQVRLQQIQAAEEHEAALIAAVQAEADSTSQLAEVRNYFSPKTHITAKAFAVTNGLPQA